MRAYIFSIKFLKNSLFLLIMSDEQKINICKKVFERLNDKEHLVSINLLKQKLIPEIAIIEGINK